MKEEKEEGGRQKRKEEEHDGTMHQWQDWRENEQDVDRIMEKKEEKEETMTWEIENVQDFKRIMEKRKVEEHDRTVNQWKEWREKRMAGC